MVACPEFAPENIDEEESRTVVSMEEESENETNELNTANKRQRLSEAIRKRREEELNSESEDNIGFKNESRKTESQANVVVHNQNVQIENKKSNQSSTLTNGN